MGHVKVTVKCATPHENDSVPKIKINDNINLFLTAISSLLISYRNSFRLLFDNLFEKYIYIFTLGMVIPGNEHCANYIGTLLFAIVGVLISLP